MKINILTLLLLGTLGFYFVAPAGAAEATPNTLTDAERAAGWRLLFDGQSLNGWRNFRQKTVTGTNGWVIEDGWLKKVAKARGGDIITVDRFTDFELSWEWRIPRRANSGVKYFVVESRGAVGHEYQMIDDGTQKNPKILTASFYDVLPPKAHAPLKFAPEFNQSRILVQGNHVEHWLNGEKVLEYECGSEEVLAGVAKSKFKNTKDFGTKLEAHILLTDHTDECSFRNVKVRQLQTK